MEIREIYETPESEIVVCDLDTIRMLNLESSTTGGDGGWDLDEGDLDDW